MELKSTYIGQCLAQHPYNKVRLLNTGVEVSGKNHQYLIPFNQLIDIRCKRGIFWGELEFELQNNQVVRLHGTEWKKTQHFFHNLIDIWKKWNQEMSLICANILSTQVKEIKKYLTQDSWLSKKQLTQLQKKINNKLNVLPIPLIRLNEFVNCQQNFAICQYWLNLSCQSLWDINQYWVAQLIKQYSEFFQRFTITPLNRSQVNCVVNSEENILVLGGPGSGKTSVLIAKIGWLLLKKQAIPEQILLLAFDNKTAKKMDWLVHNHVGARGFHTKTFNNLVLDIIQTSKNKHFSISELEVNQKKRYKLLINEWRNQCYKKKSQADGWRDYLTRELGWNIASGEFWFDNQLASRIVIRLDNWINLLRKYGGSQKIISKSVVLADRNKLQMELQLVAPMMKRWKSTIQSEGAIDSLRLTQQAINLLQKGKFISQWKHILIDEFQDLSPLEMQLLQLLRIQNRQAYIFSVGDDEQAMCRFQESKLNSIATFTHYFGSGVCCTLDTTYRLNAYTAKIANKFIHIYDKQQMMPLKSFVENNKKSILLLPKDQLENLLHKMSGYVSEEETILVLSRYFYLKSEIIKTANIRWPKLNIKFMTIQSAKGHQSDYVIILGLQHGIDGFPICEPESEIEKVLLQQHARLYSDQEKRLLYIALTRAKKQVYLLYDKVNPSVFVKQLKKIGVLQKQSL
ncbi:MAG: DNA helicase IV [Candidatus Arsenophonus melophagi]|nr:DNA helicase IV [Candidatus Arsenophonus melophagi]